VVAVWLQVTIRRQESESTRSRTDCDPPALGPCRGIVASRPALWEGDRSSIFSDIVFTGEDKLVREAVGYEQQTAEAALSHIGFAPCEPTFQRRLDIGDPQISPTRLHFQLWRSFQRYDARCFLRTWTYRIARQVAFRMSCVSGGSSRLLWVWKNSKMRT